MNVPKWVALPGPAWLYKAFPGGQMSVNVGVCPGCGYSTHLPAFPRFLVTVLAPTLSSSNELRP